MTSQKSTFIKAYTRNFSIIMQQAWFAANKEKLVSRLGVDEFPFELPYLYFMKDGVEEVWENLEANKWGLEKVVEKIKTDDSFFMSVHSRYFERLEQVKKWWEKGVATKEELDTFLILMDEGVADFVILYSALMDPSLPENYKRLAEEFREKDSFFASSNTTLWNALTTLYPELGYLVVYITREELHAIPSKEELLMRDKGFALLPGKYVGALSFDELVKKFAEYTFVLEKGERVADALKGQVAFKGKATGRVRIVKRKDQVEATLEGEILVSPMTTPDMVSAMRKAAAFVTDEGGITCHAAIIARELKKPCVVGTKTATQVFKDGDLVEVDAEKGIVTILQ